MNIEQEFAKRITFLSRRQQKQVRDAFRETIAEVAGLALPKKSKPKVMFVDESGNLTSHQVEFLNARHKAPQTVSISAEWNKAAPDLEKCLPEERERLLNGVWADESLNLPPFPSLLKTQALDPDFNPSKCQCIGPDAGPLNRCDECPR